MVMGAARVDGLWSEKNGKGGEALSSTRPQPHREGDGVDAPRLFLTSKKPRSFLVPCRMNSVAVRLPFLVSFRRRFLGWPGGMFVLAAAKRIRLVALADSSSLSRPAGARTNSVTTFLQLFPSDSA